MVSKQQRVAAMFGEVANSRYAFDAVIFDMDGVLTQTASVHAMAWKQSFDAFLRNDAAQRGIVLCPFEHPGDYLKFVDGRPRYQGVEAFLKSRSIELPYGTPADDPGFDTICAVGNLKNEAFNRIVEAEGVALYDTTVGFIYQLKEARIKVGLATSSRNSDLILEKSGVASLFTTVVDGLVSAKLGLKGKPEPDIFSTAAFCLGVTPSRSIVVEDAVSGVQAGSRGGFALTLGIAREKNERELEENGADLVVHDLSETSPEALNRFLIERQGHE